jgi:hypothetical protein
MNKSLASLVLALGCASALAAEGPARLPANVEACAEVKDAAQRAACYDREVAITRGAARTPAASTPPARAAVAPPAASADFGSESLVRKPQPADQAPVLEARIAELTEQLPGTYIITLDNGQVWRQPEARAAFVLKPGDEVRIKKGAMGSYRMWLESQGSKRWVRVLRVR